VKVGVITLTKGRSAANHAVADPLAGMHSAAYRAYGWCTATDGCVACSLRRT